MKAATRNKLPAAQFGLPGQRKYPVDTPGRAANAKARASQQVKAGNLTPDQEGQIDRKADAKLGKNDDAVNVLRNPMAPTANESVMLGKKVGRRPKGLLGM